MSLLGISALAAALRKLVFKHQYSKPGHSKPNTQTRNCPSPLNYPHDT
jgi:hypothetical protein